MHNQNQMRVDMNSSKEKETTFGFKTRPAARLAGITAYCALVAGAVSAASLYLFPLVPTLPDAMERWILLAFVSVGVFAGASTIYFLLRSPQPLWQGAKALLTGSTVSTILAAAGTKIAGGAIEITWFQAGCISFVSYTGSVIICALGAGVLYWYVLGRQLRVKRGMDYAVLGLTELAGGFKRFADLLRQSAADAHADEVWDEFAVAIWSLRDKLKDAENAVSGGWAPPGYENLLAYTSVMSGIVSPAKGARVASESVRVVLSPTISELCARLCHSTLNFTVWRLSDDLRTLEHVASLPIDIAHSPGVPPKDRLPVWEDSTHAKAGSLAGSAVLRRRYQVIHSGEPLDGWPERGLGSKYHSVAAMPIPAEGEEGDCWGVVCVESRAGSLPLKSKLMAELLRMISCTVNTQQASLRVAEVKQKEGGAEIQRVETRPSLRVGAPSEAAPSASATQSTDNTLVEIKSNVPVVDQYQSNPEAQREPNQ